MVLLLVKLIGAVTDKQKGEKYLFGGKKTEIISKVTFEHKFVSIRRIGDLLTRMASKKGPLNLRKQIFLFLFP